MMLGIFSFTKYLSPFIENAVNAVKRARTLSLVWDSLSGFGVWPLLALNRYATGGYMPVDVLRPYILDGHKLTGTSYKFYSNPRRDALELVMKNQKRLVPAIIPLETEIEYMERNILIPFAKLHIRVRRGATIEEIQEGFRNHVRVNCVACKENITIMYSREQDNGVMRRPRCHPNNKGQERWTRNSDRCLIHRRRRLVRRLEDKLYKVIIVRCFGQRMWNDKGVQCEAPRSTESSGAQITIDFR